MLKPSERVVVGVSGGADSVCLFLMLLSYREKVPLSLAVVHVNHGIRKDAGEDARYVEELCGRYDIPFFLEAADVRRLARERGYSEEDAGRRVRYNAFYKTAERLGGAKIAVAHNSNDNAETMLFHLFRGSGLQGLGGIAPVRDGIIRPILCLERREVEAYLESRGVEWRLDSTNEGDCYRRNRIRHHILPYAEAEVANGVVEHMGRTAELLRETERYLEQQTLEAMEKCVEVYGKTNNKMLYSEGQAVPDKEWGGLLLDVATFLEFPEILQKRMLLKGLELLSPTGKDIGEVHVRDTLGLFERDGNRRLDLPFGIKARRQYGIVTLERSPGGRQEPCRGQTTWEAEGMASGDFPDCAWQQVPIAVILDEKIFLSPLVYDLGNMGNMKVNFHTMEFVKMEFRGFFLKKDQKVPIKRYTKWFDYDKIKECLVIRSRCQGDFFTIADKSGNMVHKSLKDYMITEKIPRQIRDKIPLVAAGSHVLWLPGWRISEYFKVDANTERVVQVRLLGAKFCEGSETEEENVGTH